MIHFAVLKAAFVSQRRLIYTNKQRWMGMPGGRGLIGRSLSARLTGQQCGAAKCGGVHTEPLPLHRPGSLPPSLPGLASSFPARWVDTREALIPLVPVH